MNKLTQRYAIFHKDSDKVYQYVFMAPKMLEQDADNAYAFIGNENFINAVNAVNEKRATRETVFEPLFRKDHVIFKCIAEDVLRSVETLTGKPVTLDSLSHQVAMMLVSAHAYNNLADHCIYINTAKDELRREAN